MAQRYRETPYCIVFSVDHCMCQIQYQLQKFWRWDQSSQYIYSICPCLERALFLNIPIGRGFVIKQPCWLFSSSLNILENILRFLTSVSPSKRKL